MADLIERSAALKAVNDCGICIQKILDISEVDAVPVVHGRWIHLGFMACKCSVCDEPVYENGGTDYCPNCGARMDGKDEA